MLTSSDVGSVVESEIAVVAVLFLALSPTGSPLYAIRYHSSSEVLRQLARLLNVTVEYIW